MNYMCCKCKDIFSANNDNEVVWTYGMPLCSGCKTTDKKETLEED